jgi:hypothetical protein
MKSLYIKAMKRARLERFAGYFFRGACVFGLCAAIFAGAYTMGQKHGYSAGLVAGAIESQACKSRGGNGYFIDSLGFHCLYE